MIEELAWWMGLEGEDLIVNTQGLPAYDLAPVVDHIVDQLGDVDRVLDLGCGPGRLTSVVALDFPDVVGVDPSPKGQRGSDVTWVVSDGRTIPLPDASFDGAYTVTVFQHLPADVVRGYLREMHRVLRTGSRFVVQYVAGTGDSFASHLVETETLAGWMNDAGFDPFPTPGPCADWSWMTGVRR